MSGLVKKEEEVDEEVTREDQDNINAFGRLNNRLHEIEDEQKELQDQINNIQDASNELLLADDDGPLKYLIGEVYVDLPKSAVEGLLEKEEKKHHQNVEDLNTEHDSIKKTLASLKVKLYSKFASSINLEEE